MRRRSVYRGEAQRNGCWAPLCMVGVVLTGSLVAGPVFGQSAVPELVKPRSAGPTLPPGRDGTTTPQPRSESPQTDAGSNRPIPDNGVIAPPVSGLGSPSVIKPPAQGTMPIIPPPGSSGGVTGVVPK